MNTIRTACFIFSLCLITRKRVIEKNIMESEAGKKGRNLNAMRPAIKEMTGFSTFSK
ncbi:MAG: hypothetical protein ISR97_04025 [Nitrospira sp.]|nr:hypothetical protein [Nitrospira sp.]